MRALESEFSLPQSKKKKKIALGKKFKFPIKFSWFCVPNLYNNLYEYYNLRTKTHTKKHSFHPPFEVFILPHRVYSILF